MDQRTLSPHVPKLQLRQEQLGLSNLKTARPLPVSVASSSNLPCLRNSRARVYSIGLLFLGLATKRNSDGFCFSLEIC